MDVGPLTPALRICRPPFTPYHTTYPCLHYQHQYLSSSSFLQTLHHDLYLGPTINISQYMKESPRKTELSLRQSEHDPRDTFPERHHYAPTNIDDNPSFFEDALHDPGQSGNLQGYHESYSQRYGNANEFSQSHIPGFGFGAEGTASQDPQHSGQPWRFATQPDNPLLRGVENYAELPSPSCRDRELMGSPAQTYNMHQRSFSLGVPSFAPMPSYPQPSSRHSSAPPRAEGQASAYGPFQRRFEGPEEARQYRRTKTRCGRVPWIKPGEDNTIREVESERGRHVERIYNAMISVHRYRDNKQSTAEKRWVTATHYDPAMIEAYAHRVFDALMEQVKEGYRGWPTNDYVNDERKGEDDDKDADCAMRLDNIIDALELEKTICENVMSSAWQIRMFVNAPKAYSKRKFQNRVGNSKRPNAKSNVTPDDDPRPSKRAKTTARGRQNIGRSSTGPEVSLSRSATPQQPFQPPELPYFARPAIAPNHIASSPATSFLAPPAPPMRPAPRSFGGPFGPQQTNAMSPQTQPRTPQPQAITRISTMSPAQQSAFSPPSQSHFSAPATPDVKQNMQPWEQSAFGGPSCSGLAQMNQCDNSDFPHILDWQHGVQPYSHLEVPGSANIFEQHPEMSVNPADLMLHPMESDLTGFWQQPYHDFHPNNQNQP
jgi:hypothetical protein